MTIIKAICEAQMLADGRTCQLNMYGPIGRNIFGEGITPAMVSDQLAANPHCDKISVRMSSPGGNVFDGQSIRSILHSHPAHVTVTVEGLAASAASVVAMGADRIEMHDGSAMMLHDATAQTQGDARAHELAISRLKAINASMASLYAQRSGKSVEAVQKMMTAETWLTAQQAVERGFADEVLPGKAKAPQASFAIDTHALGYAHEVPDQFTGFFHTETPQQTPAAKTQPAIITQPERVEMTDFTRVAQSLALSNDAGESAVLSALDKIKMQLAAADKLTAQLTMLTGTDNLQSAFGVVQAHAEAAKQLPVIKAQAEEQIKQLEAAERAALFAADASDPKGRKLTPATQKYWEAMPVDQLKSFLAVSPVVLVTAPVKGGEQPAVNVSTGNAPAGVVAMTYEGKSWEQHVAESPLALQGLWEHDRAQFDALKKNHEERGKPRVLPTPAAQPARKSA